MTTSSPKTFTALLEGDGTALRWVIARVPFDVQKAWPNRKRLRVRGHINGFAFRTSLFPIPGGDGHMLLVNKKMQAGAKAYRGDKARITLEPDLEEREALMPAELARALKGDRQLRKWFDGLSEYTRRTFCALVDEVKSPEARQRMAERIAERLLLTMEGELETPPILKAAFVRQPMAEAGWKAMTATQRRSHLLGIFYYESVEARERRAGKAVEDALKAARKRAASPKSGAK
ncbi:MAG: YdeI/OmpD-associated family protein [Terracidiphilus sp.]